ncbi:MAG: hypothetical protein ABIP17_17445 [Ilumatobacteraceae bacterium]
MNTMLRFLRERLGVLGSWASIGRVVAWVAVWAVVIGVVFAPRGPAPADRERDADAPPSDVRYLGPTSKQDLAGFVTPPERLDDPFTVAWIGGSEVKLREVSVAGEVDGRIRMFGDRPVQIDAYTLLAPRPIDVIRAVDAAVADGVDAIVLSINATWVTDEWSMREWPNLDVANVGSLLRRPSTWPWELALTSPADVSWRVTRAIVPVVEAQNRLNGDAQDLVDAFDVVSQPGDDPAPGPAPIDGGPIDGIPPDDELDPRLPDDATSFWLVEEYGPSILDDTTQRVATMVDGLADDSPVADALNLRLVQAIEAAGIPAYLYVAPFSPEALADPELADAARQVEAYWTGIAARVESPLVEIEPGQLSSRFAVPARYFDLVHMADAGPFADVLVPVLCANWQRADPDRVCS